MLTNLALHQRKSLHLALFAFLTLVSCLLLATLRPVIAFASWADDFIVYVGEVRVDETNMQDVLGDGKVSFAIDEQAKKGVLSMNGTTVIAAPHDGDPILFGLYFEGLDEVEVVYSGQNLITNMETLAGDTIIGGAKAAHEAGIFALCNVLTVRSLNKATSSLDINLVGGAETEDMWGVYWALVDGEEFLPTSFVAKDANLSVNLEADANATNTSCCVGLCGSKIDLDASEAYVNVQAGRSLQAVGVDADSVILRNTSAMQLEAVTNTARNKNGNLYNGAYGMLVGDELQIKDTSVLVAYAANAYQNGIACGIDADYDGTVANFSVEDNATLEVQGSTVAITGATVDLTKHAKGGAMVNTNASAAGAKTWNAPTDAPLSADQIESAVWKYVLVPEHSHTAGPATNENVVAPTCTARGSHDVVVRCTSCNMEISRTSVIDAALGHDWGDWITTTPASTTSEGVETRTCNRCGTTETRTTPKLCKITFNPGGGTFSDGSTASISYEYPKGTTITLPEAPTRSGYTFQYWSSSDYKPGTSYTVTTSITFTARWTKDSSSSTSTTTKASTTSTSSTSSSTLAKTGDSTNQLAMLILPVAGLMVVGAGFLARRKA